MMILSFMWTKNSILLSYFKTMHLLLGLPSNLPSLLPFLNNNTKKATEQVTKSFLNENKRVRGWNPQKTTKLDGNDTTTLSLLFVYLQQLTTLNSSRHVPGLLP